MNHPNRKETITVLVDGRTKAKLRRLAGAVGNLIDRALFGYVTDMFQTLFIHFAVFNVADICVVCGGIGFCVYYLFFHGRGDGHGADSAEG